MLWVKERQTISRVEEIASKEFRPISKTFETF